MGPYIPVVEGLPSSSEEGPVSDEIRRRVT